MFDNNNQLVFIGRDKVYKTTNLQQVTYDRCTLINLITIVPIVITIETNYGQITVSQ